jgi:hypothetical protein
MTFLHILTFWRSAVSTAHSLITAQRRSKGTRLEDLFLAQFAQCLALQFHGGDFGFLRISFHSLSSDTLPTYAMGKKASFCASGKVALGDITVVFGPSAPNRVATIHHGVFAASEQAALWRTMLNSSQKQHDLSRKLIVSGVQVVPRQIWLKEMWIIKLSWTHCLGDLRNACITRFLAATSTTTISTRTKMSNSKAPV